MSHARKSLQAAIIAGFAVLASAQAPVWAGDIDSDRAQAISVCRAELAQQAGVEATSSTIDLDRIRTKPRVVELRFRVSGRDGASWYAQCDVRRTTGEIAELTHGQGALLAGAPTTVAVN